MKRVIATISMLLCVTVLAAPHFVTPAMIKRNGLTDEQYEYLWSIGKNPKIDIATARDWTFRANRYQNVTNWLDICGVTNDFAKLSYKLQDDNFKLEEYNDILVATNRTLTSTCEQLASEVVNMWDNYTNQLAKTTALSNAYVIVSAQAEAATAKIQDEIADLQAKITKYEEYKTKYPLLKAIFTAMITDAENRIKILQALTGGNQ